MPRLILYKNRLEDNDPDVEDAIDLLNQTVGGKNYTVEDGAPENPILTGEPPYLEVDAGLGDKNNPTHSYQDLEEVLNALDYSERSDRDTDTGRA